MSEGASAVSPLLVPAQLQNMLSGHVAIRFGCTGPNLGVATACASGATAIGVAKDLLALDRCDIVITGGSEAMLTPLVMAGFAQMGALSSRVGDPLSASRPFDAARDGFVGGEGAGVLIIERMADARARRAHVHARLVGYGASADAYHITTPRSDARGIETAVRVALADAGAVPGDVRHVNAHASSTSRGDLAEGKMLRRIFGTDPVVTSTKGVTGHLLGAAGAVEAIHTILAVEHQTVPPTANLDFLDPQLDIDVPHVAKSTKIGLALSNSFGFGGQNAILAVAPA